VPNWNYNSFSVGLLAAAYQCGGEGKYLEGAVRKLELGVLPGQLEEGPRQGRWADPHNARPAYHYIMCRHLARLLEVMPDQHPARGELAASLSRALKARNEEYVTRGVMNRDSALEALVEVERLGERSRAELGECLVAEALGALEGLVTEELRRGRMSLSPGALGLLLERRLKQAGE
jgi:hypothetical protein